MKQELRTIHCYDVASFVTEIEKAVKDGFSLDLVTPQNYPQQIGWQFITTMIKDSVEQDGEPVKDTASPAAQEVSAGTADVTQVAIEAPKKAGRPAKGK